MSRPMARVHGFQPHPGPCGKPATPDANRAACRSARTCRCTGWTRPGFSIGLAGLPVTAVILAIALQAFLAAQLGLAIGARIGERWRERAEQAAGIALILLGGYLIAEQLATG